MRKIVNMRWSEELLERVNARSAELGQTRTAFVERALEVALDDDVARLRSDIERVSRPVSPAPTLSGKRPGSYEPIPKKTGR